MAGRSESVEAVRRYYDALGEQEWTRLTGSVRGRVSLELHRRFCAASCAPLARARGRRTTGRFTLELAALGCRVVVTNLSEAQLALNEERLVAADAERCVDGVSC